MHLTGEHPLNGEAQLDKLSQSLFTPTKMHYVRNHGRVPRIDSQRHVLQIGGLVRHPRSFTLAELRQLPQERVAVTLTCDGNRRKELNMMKHTLGFDWGPGATSCSWWTGVQVRLLIQECGGLAEGAKFVCFDGNEGEELAHGIYGTSLPLASVLSPYSDVLIAVAMNDEPLTPDHGAPMRLVVPGHVGGRSIKWLSRIEVSKEESKSRYHREDNLALPANVTSFTEAASLFGKPEYVLYEMNVNSVIFAPAHSEWIDTQELSEPYVVRGYAYAGGGRRVTRVEVTMDGGKTWELAQIVYPENVTRHDAFVYCWCHWSLSVPRWRLLGTEEIACRAVDAAMSMQPEGLTWNTHGTMNNAWYRVKLSSKYGGAPSFRDNRMYPRFSQHGHVRYSSDAPVRSGKLEAVDALAKERGDRERRLLDRAQREQNAPGVTPAVGCDHPLAPGELLGGWMQFEHRAPPAIHMHRAPEPAHATTAWFTLDEVAKHNTEHDCWIIVDGFALDVTPFMAEHPGGKHAFLVAAGTDVTHLFYSIHAHDAYEIMDRFIIGRIKSSVQRPASHGEWIDAKLIDRKRITHDTIWLLLEPSRQVTCPAGQHVLLAAEMSGEWVVRPYSPTRVTAEGRLELLVKVYDARPGIPAGRMSTWLTETVALEACVRLKVPCGYIAYGGKGELGVYSDAFALRRYSFVAGGTG